MIDSTLVALARDAANYGITQIERFSPVVWEMAQHKIVADMWCHIIGGLALILASAVLAWLCCKAIKNGWDFFDALLGSLAFIAFVPGAITEAIGIYLWIMTHYAMDYMTLQTILKMFGH